MAEKFEQFSMDDMMALARSPVGQQLLAMLRQSGGESLQQAAGKAMSGDLEGAKALLSPILADPQVRALLDQMGGK